MDLSQMTIPDFMELLASKSPTPGGGGAAALSGAQGAALSSMVCSLTLGKKKYVEYQDFANDTREKLFDIIGSFLKLIDKDAAEFNKMSSVFSMANESDEEKLARKMAMERALKACVMPPFAVMGLSLEALNITKELIGKTYTGAASDIGVAALSLKAALESGWLNVLININSIEDKAFAESLRTQGQAMLDKGIPLADEIYNSIKDSL